MRLYLTFIFLYCAFHSYAGDVHFTVKNGLPNSTVYFAMQDSKDFIWFCTATGVSRYDGRKFENFTMSEGLADNEIFRCIEDSKGRIWFLSYNGKLSFFYKGKMHNPQNTPWLSYDNTGAFLLNAIEDKKENLWFTTSLGFIIKITNCTLTKYKPSITGKQFNNAYISSFIFLENDSVKKFAQDKLDTVFIENLISGKLTKCNSIKNLAERSVELSKYEAQSGDQLFIADHKVLCYKQNEFKIISLDALKSRYPPMAILKDTLGWWIATGGDGAYFVDTRHSIYKPRHWLAKEIITDILKDKEGNLWFTTYNSGVFLHKSYDKVSTVLPVGMTNSLALTYLKNKPILIAGCGNGNIELLKSSTVQKTVEFSKGPFDRVNGIIAISPTQIIIEKDNSIVSYNPVTNTFFTIEDRPGNKNYYRSGNTIWFCADDHIIKWLNGKLYRQKNMLPFSKITSIAAISDSIQYIGTIYRLYKTVGNKVSEVLNDSLLKTSINALSIIDGRLWVATHGNGIFIIDHDTVLRHIEYPEDVLASNICKKIYDDGNKYTWIATNKGITAIDRFNYQCVFNITTSDGIISDDIKDIISDQNKLYVATAAGVNIVALDGLKKLVQPPKVYITSIRTSNSYLLDPGNNFVYNYFKGFITVSFTAVTFKSPDDVKYQYKFDNNEWNSTQSTDIPIFDLSPGSHTLFFRAKKYNSSWSSPIFLNITVTPLWYQRKRVQLFLLLLLVGIAWYAIRNRIKNIRATASEKTLLHKKISELKGSALAHQMNPHFIFNSLNTVQQFILTNNEVEGLNYLSEFSKLMRNMLENSRKERIDLDEEINFLTRYLQLETIRFENRFAYAIIVGQDLYNTGITLPPALFQPLLENAIKHGVSSIKGNGLISLKISLKGEYLEGVVEDNGKGISEVVSSRQNERQPTALKVIEERISLMKGKNGESGYLTIINKADRGSSSTGTIVKLLIPLTNGN